MSKATGRPGQPDPLLRLVDDGVLTADQLAAVRLALQDTSTARPVPWTEIAGYLGGGLVLAGAVLLVTTSWGRLTDAARAALVGGFAGALLVAGVIAAGGLRTLWTARGLRQTARLRVAAVLLALGAAAAALTLGIGLPHDVGSWRTTASGGLGFLLAAVGYVLVPTVVGLVASIGLGLVCAVGATDALGGVGPLRFGLTLFGCGLAVMVLGVSRVLRQPLTALGIGSVLGFLGAQQLLADDAVLLGYLLTGALSAALLVLHRSVRSWLPLVLGVIGVAVAVPEAIWDLTGGAVGGAAIPLIGGLILITASGIGLRRKRQR